MLELSLLIPLLGIAHLTRIPRESFVRLKRAALGWSLVELSSTIGLWATFDECGQFQAIIKVKWTLLEPICSPVLAVDGISIFFIILTAFLTPICILVS